MRPRPRIRKTAKWGSAALTVMLVITWVGSSSWSAWIRIAKPTRANGQTLFIHQGQVGYQFGAARSQPLIVLTRMQVQPTIYWWFMWWRPFHHWGWFAVPLWIPILFSFSITAIACRLDTLARRDTARRCRCCDYDLIGLSASSPCPECGTSLIPS